MHFAETSMLCPHRENNPTQTQSSYRLLRGGLRMSTLQTSCAQFFQVQNRATSPASQGHTRGDDQCPASGSCGAYQLLPPLPSWGAFSPPPAKFYPLSQRRSCQILLSTSEPSQETRTTRPPGREASTATRILALPLPVLGRVSCSR